MKRRCRSCFLIGPAAVLLLLAAACKDATKETSSPLSPPAWIQGTWVDQGYIEKSVIGSGWEFTQDNAIRHDFMYGLPHLAPWDFFKFYLECLQGIHDYGYTLTDFSSDTYYELRETFTSLNPTTMIYKFFKLTPTTFHHTYSSAGSATTDAGVFTKE